jgi:AcrR family transcriptional regulator
MKINQEQKQKNREAILEAAVDLIIQKDFKSASMRAIARRAGLGDATIYNYFPTKESILFAYYGDNIRQAAGGLEKLPDYDKYSFQERLQAYFEICLESFLKDREFLQKTFKIVFYPITPHQDLKAIREVFIACLQGIFDQAVEDSEIEEPPFRELTYHFFWDYFVGVVFYWLSDSSEDFLDTTELINKTMDLACAVLKAGVVNKVFDIASFLFRNHIVSRMETFKHGLNAFDEIKRQFAEDINEPDHTGK